MQEQDLVGNELEPCEQDPVGDELHHSYQPGPVPHSMGLGDPVTSRTVPWWGRPLQESEDMPPRPMGGHTGGPSPSLSGFCDGPRLPGPPCLPIRALSDEDRDRVWSPLKERARAHRADEGSKALLDPKLECMVISRDPVQLGQHDSAQTEFDVRDSPFYGNRRVSEARWPLDTSRVFPGQDEQASPEPEHAPCLLLNGTRDVATGLFKQCDASRPQLPLLSRIPPLVEKPQTRPARDLRPMAGKAFKEPRAEDEEHREVGHSSPNPCRQFQFQSAMSTPTAISSRHRCVTPTPSREQAQVRRPIAFPAIKWRIRAERSSAEVDIGLDLVDIQATKDREGALKVVGVRAGSLVDAWNIEQSNKEVRPGDFVVEANGVRGGPGDLRWVLGRDLVLDVMFLRAV